VQNVAASLGDPGYRIGMGALLFFTLPLCFALFYGRTFCAGVCPLGAIQELFIWRPQRVPPWIAHVLGMIPWIYLGAAVLFAAVGARFLICLYDPFVGFFRLGGPLGIMAAGGALLVLGLFVARPYCRFLCPYGVLLGCFSLVSRRHLSITPDRCIQCRLCEDSCPVGAIEKPESPGEPGRSGRSPLRLGFWMLMVPVSIAVFGFGVRQLAPVMARSHQTVRLARQVRLEREGMAKHETLDSEAFRQRGESFETLYREAGRVKRRFETGGWILGAFLGLVFASKGIVLTLKPRRTDYEPDRFHCVSCGRCMEYCPVKKGDLEKR
jgi:ferredoxin